MTMKKAVIIFICFISKLQNAAKAKWAWKAISLTATAKIWLKSTSTSWKLLLTILLAFNQAIYLLISFLILSTLFF